MSLFDKIKDKGRGYATALILKKAAAGELGPQAKWIYWHLREIKTDIGILLGVAAGVMAVLINTGACDLAANYWTWVHCDVWAAHIEHATVIVASIFLYLGQVDGGLHLDSPPKAG